MLAELNLVIIVALRQQADSRPNLILSSLFPPDSERQMLNAKLASRYAPILRSEGDYVMSRWITERPCRS